MISHDFKNSFFTKRLKFRLFIQGFVVPVCKLWFIDFVIFLFSSLPSLRFEGANNAFISIKFVWSAFVALLNFCFSQVFFVSGFLFDLAILKELYMGMLETKDVREGFDSSIKTIKQLTEKIEKILKNRTLEKFYPVIGVILGIPFYIIFYLR